MENSKIQWCHHTFNPWIGCDKVAPECANCYAEALMDKRYGRVEWGAGKERSRTTESNWKLPLRWNKVAAKKGDRPRVFCASLADWLDDEVPIEWLADLMVLIERTQNLDWLLLSKRVQDWRDRMDRVRRLSFNRTASEIAEDWLNGSYPHNVWVGTSAGCQQTADRNIPALAGIPARIRFVSAEPLLGMVDLTNLPTEELHWIIVGGESGAGARRCDGAWMRSLKHQCSDRAIAFFVKQLGANFVDGDYPEIDYSRLKNTGGVAAFPSDLQIRDFPISIGVNRDD